ncbi:MAG: tetratricopeptide repeat protein [Candidatus Omnitrophica bacterium]|nr:tetratricopeptide repeat protein [Candidatus Omnitrophota bacterium]
MSDAFYKKLCYLIGLLPIGALFGLMAFMARIEIKDLDLWLHLGVGKYITLSGSIPQTDIFNVVTTGKFWNNHEWLFQVLVYNIFHSWGMDGVQMMQVVVVTMTMLILLLIGYNRDRQLLTTLALMGVYFIYQTRFTIRPDLFSLLFFTIYIYIMALHIDKRWSLFVLVLIQILWSNFHGFFFFGPLFVFVGFISEWLKRHVPLPYQWNETGRLTDQEFGLVKKALFFVSLACLVNPQFVHGAIYPIKVFFSLSGENKVFFDYIQELKSPIHWSAFFDGEGGYGYYKIMIMISALSFFLNRRQIDISALFLWLIFLFFSLKAIRNISFFAFAAYLVIITNSYTLSAAEVFPIKFRGKKFSYITGIFVSLILLAFIFDNCRTLAQRGYYDFDLYERKSEFGGIAQRSFPIKAVNFIIENGIKANIFNDFNSGAYFIGRAYPNIKVFMDGRTELYGGEFFKKYAEIWDKGNSVVLEEMVKKYHLTGAFLNSSREQIPEELLKYLDKSEEWTPVYFDYDGVFFLKNVPEHKDTIDRFAIDFNQWVPPNTDLLRLGAANVDPYPNSYRAFTLESMGYDDAALKEVKVALKIKPSYSDPLQLRGKILTKRKQYKDAFQAFRQAALFDPYNKKNRYNLAMSYLDMAEYDGAVEQYRILRGMWPEDPKAVFLLSKAYAYNRQYDDSLKIFKEAASMRPENIGDFLVIADMVYNDRKYETALEMYNAILLKNDHFAQAHFKAGLCYQHLKNIGQAKEHFTKAVEIEPEKKEYKSALESIN